MPKLIERLTASVYRTEFRSDDLTLAFGTGFFIERAGKYFFVTNRHNLRGRNNDTNEILHSQLGLPNNFKVLVPFLNHDSEGNAKPIDNVVTYTYVEGKNAWYDSLNFGENADFGIVQMDFPEDVNPVSCNGNIEEIDLDIGPSSRVTIVGFPYGLDTSEGHPFFLDAAIASELELTDKPGVFYVDCRARRGCSGSPVVAVFRHGLPVPMKNGMTLYNGTGHALLGIYCGRINHDSDIGIVWKINEIYATADAVLAKKHDGIKYFKDEF